MARVSTLIIVSLAIVAGCDDSMGGASGVALPWIPEPFPTMPQTDAPTVRFELGRLLFFDPVLSVDGETACGTCHSDVWGLGDGLPLAIGHGAGILAGPGREGPNVLRRNAPPLWNLAFRKTLLWDGRVATLEEQALEPINAVDEFNRTPEDVVADLASIPEYVALFEESFPNDPNINIANLTIALADYQRTFVSKRSLYDGYVAGDTNAMSEEMVEGMFRFAEFGCGDCHTQPLFESERFENRNVPTIESIDDEGRFEVTGREEDHLAFRVPSLRNVAFANPYFHNGTGAHLEDAVRHELSQGSLEFDASDVTLISVFIGDALRDESHEPQRPSHVPSGLPIPLDGTQVQR